MIDYLQETNLMIGRQHQLQKKEREIMDVYFRHEWIKVSNRLHTDQLEMEKQYRKL